jgi:hypothetical protein
MAFRFVTADADGVLYAVRADGELEFYRDQARDGTANWANGGQGLVIGHDWGDFVNVFSGGDGILYAVNAASELLFYRDTARDGTEAWANGGDGKSIGAGWDTFTHVVSGGDGILYAVDAAGDLLYFRDQARDGTADWAFDGQGQKIASGWGAFLQVVSGGDGILYAVTDSGDLLYFRDEAGDGTAKWSFGGAGQKLASGWDKYSLVVGGQDGILYALTPDGALLFFRDLARNGTANWANQGVGKRIGQGWQLAQHGPTDPLGYCWPLSAAPGETIDFHVASPSAYRVAYVRYHSAGGANLGVKVGAAPDRPANPLPVPPLAWKTGCGWPTSFSLTIPADWPSGIYGAECSAPGANTFAIVFVVKPAAGVNADFLTLANTNTWNAYNDFGGRSKYTTPPAAQLSFERPNPHAGPSGDWHLTRAELWVHGWLQSAGYNVDVVTDYDFHQGVPGLLAYKGIILHTHPEYWSLAMLNRLQAYLDAGGRLLYLAGNGVYEEVTFAPDGKVLTLLHGDDTTPREQCLLRNLVPPRPERTLLGVAFEDQNYYTFAPFSVLEPAHRFLAPLGLTAGQLIGDQGYNDKASGWEMDTAAGAGAAAGVQVLARGTNTGEDGTVYGGDMTYRDTSAGGWVFSAGSLTFGGSLAMDAALQGIVANALNECL